jgi:hypothetical protein
MSTASPDAPPAPSDLDLYYRVEVAESAMEETAAKLRELSTVVDAAYVKPAPSPASEPINRMAPRADDAPPASPDFSARQQYLDDAPVGVAARFAWTQPGGRGAGVRVIDIEGAWRFTHEDLTQNQGGVAGGVELTDLGWRNHGTAVIGVIGGDRNAFGVTGISPDAHVRAISIFGELGTAGAIRRAADLLGPGDIILIELHRPGPGAGGFGQDGFIAIEWWPDDYDAIRYAVSRGVIVVEAAGNGARDLDAAIYDNPDPGFPASWSNPFRRGARDSGAVLVGAGAPPPGTHGADHGPDRSRLDFSNYGSAVDAQGWGREVTTCGYGDLQGGANEDLWYTDRFSGTSSASPIVVGSIACVQGVQRAASRPLLTPARARALLRETGSSQQDAPGRPATQRIGQRPDLRELLARVSPRPTVPLHRYWNPTIGDHFYTTNFAELRHGGHGWRYEGIQCYVHRDTGAGLTALHRYWNPSIGDHFYTTNWAELGGGAHGWAYEGIQCYVHAAGGGAGATRLFRYWNATIGDHFYTTNWAELGAGRFGYAFEGVQCYVDTHADLAIEAAPVATQQVVAPSFALAEAQGELQQPAPSFTLQREGSASIPATFRGAQQQDAGPVPPAAKPARGDEAQSEAGGSFVVQARPFELAKKSNGHGAQDITIHIAGA